MFDKIQTGLFSVTLCTAWLLLCWFQETPHSAGVRYSDIHQRNRNYIKTGYCVKQGAVVSIVNYIPLLCFAFLHIRGPAVCWCSVVSGTVYFYYRATEFI